MDRELYQLSITDNGLNKDTHSVSLSSLSFWQTVIEYRLNHVLDKAEILTVWLSQANWEGVCVFTDHGSRNNYDGHALTDHVLSRRHGSGENILFASWASIRCKRCKIMFSVQDEAVIWSVNQCQNSVRKHAFFGKCFVSLIEQHIQNKLTYKALSGSTAHNVSGLLGY